VQASPDGATGAVPSRIVWKLGDDVSEH